MELLRKKMLKVEVGRCEDLPRKSKPLDLKSPVTHEEFSREVGRLLDRLSDAYNDMANLGARVNAVERSHASLIEELRLLRQKTYN